MNRLPEFCTRHPLSFYMDCAREGTGDSVARMMKELNSYMTIAESKFIDFALGQIETAEGIHAMKGYLFHGTQIQRNYCTLYFSRRGDHALVKEAYDKGLIDDKQAFSR